MVSVRCTPCGRIGSAQSDVAAAEGGWAFIQIRVKGRCTYRVLCPDCAPKANWLKQALAAEAAK